MAARSSLLTQLADLMHVQLDPEADDYDGVRHQGLIELVGRLESTNPRRTWRDYLPHVLGGLGLLAGLGGIVFNAGIVHSIDAVLSNYATNESVATVLATKADVTAIPAAPDLSGYATTKQVEGYAVYDDALAYAEQYLAHVDNDGDGFFGADDQCPFLKGEAQFRGCPEAYLVADGGDGIEGGDQDGDGIADLYDACKTPEADKGHVVELPYELDPDSHWVWPAEYDAAVTVGCTDTDQDGIADSGDTCAGTDSGAQVNAEGCSETDIVDIAVVQAKADKTKAKDVAYTVQIDDQPLIDGTQGTIACELKNDDKGALASFTCSKKG